MATDHSQDTFSAVIVGDPQLTEASLWAAQSSYSQAGPEPGMAEPQGTYDMVLRPSGDQTASKELRVKVLRSGHPVPDGAGSIWQEEGDSTWVGWNAPQVPTGFEVPLQSGTANRVKYCFVLTLQSGVQITAAQDLTGGQYDVVAHIRSAATPAVWSSVQVWSGPTSLPTFGAWPCMVQLNSGRVVLAHWFEGATGNQVYTHYSDDDGASWTLATKGALDAELATTSSEGVGNEHGDPGRLRMGELNGQVLLVASYKLHDTTPPTNRDVFVQYASRDDGISFSTIETWDSTVSGEGGAFHDVLAAHGQFMLFYWSLDDANLKVRRIGSAFRPLTSATAEDIDTALSTTTGSSLVSAGECTACLADDGTIYVLMQDQAVTSWLDSVYRSTDAGETWGAMGVWNYQGNSTAKPNDYHCDWLKGRIVVAAQSNQGTIDDSLFIHYLGGFTDVTMPLETGKSKSPNQIGMEGGHWLPTHLPGSVAWTDVGTGTVSLASAAMNVSTGGATLRHFTRAPAATTAAGLPVRFRVRVNSGGSITSDAVAVRIVLADGAETYDISVRLSTTAIRVYDNTAAGTVGSNGTHTGTIDMIVFLGNSFVTTYFVDGPDNQTPPRWTAGPTGAVGDGGAAAAADSIRWGHIVASVSDTDWFELHYSTDTDTVLTTIATSGQTNPDDMLPREMNRLPVYVDDGVSVSAVDGPGWTNDEWDIDTRYDSPIGRIFPANSISPRVYWESVNDDSAATIALALDSTLLATAESRFGSDLIGIMLQGVNWRTGELQRYDTGSATWVTVIEIDTATDRESMAYTRTGRSIEPNSPTDKPYLSTNEAEGWIFKLDATTFRRVKWHKEGLFDDAYSGPPLHLQLDGVTGADPASGTGSLWSTSYAGVASMAGETGAGWRLKIDAQTTIDGTFRIGSLIVGPVLMFGSDYGLGRSMETQIGVVRDEDEAGGSRQRIAQPDRREFTFSWPDGVPTSDVFGTDPGYVVASTTASSEAIATRYGVPFEIDGLARLTRGLPVCLLPRVNKSTGAPTDVRHFTRRQELAYCSLVTPVRLDVAYGTELQSTDGEGIRVSPMTFREET